MLHRWIGRAVACAAVAGLLSAYAAEETVMPTPATPATPKTEPAPTMFAPDTLPKMSNAGESPEKVDRAQARAFQGQALKALSATLDKPFEVKDQTLSAVLDLVAKGTGLTVNADKRLDAKVWDTKVSFTVPAGEDFAMVLGSAIAPAGLRYLIQDEQLFVSTPEGCAARLVGAPTVEEEKQAAADAAAQPFSAPEALEVYRHKDGDTDEMPSMDLAQPNYIEQSYARRPVTDPVTGIVHYYAPTQRVSLDRPVSPYEKYSIYPYFLTPPYLDQQRRLDQTGQAAAQQAAQEALMRYARVLKMLESNPDMKASDIMAKLKGD